MSAKHTPPGDTSFRASLLRSGAGAVGLVAVVALVFGLIGGLGPSTDGPLVADESEDDAGPAMEPDPLEADDADEADDAAAAGGDEDAEPEPVPDDTADEEEPEPEPEPEPESDEGEDVADDEQDASGTTDREFAPDSVTVQVLDGFQADGGSAAASVAASLREVGYRVVAENPALRYEVTTVLWTPGFEAQAHQVAADLGGAEVRQQPGNLSDQVQVHVVVGADRA